MNRPLPLFSLFALAACATPGAQPHDMSAAQHEATARQEEAQAPGHDAQYRPGATTTRVRCAPIGRGARAIELNSVASCWTSAVNPTDEHRRTAEDFRKRAADHRAASAALREAETTACAGIAPDDRDISPFAHTEDIVSVVRLENSTTGGKNSMRLPAGAVVTFRAVEGMTAEWLQRLVDCHLSRNSALGHAISEMPNCPLVPKGVEARVTSVGNGFAVSVRSENPTTAQEILARAQRLVAPGGGLPASQP